MRKRHIVSHIAILLIGLMLSCTTDSDGNFVYPEITDESTRASDDELLHTLYLEILELSSAFDCVNAMQWNYTPIGAKACGGPAGYIAYSSRLNERDFLKRVSHYSTQQALYNQKWGLFSTCDITPEPTGVICENGEPKLVYE
ncbi:hypothetical protein [Carboxylicivirga marina]|uniref:Lipoprotein n=1 Tax=Carboxylicivirga marina TaxID=2800988 RepID=A0ABS1HMS8_9BACT|nr:hypothetical protein [Carboxylicivirga marina]MBK3518857.1 hypothetical protein [Carboxylicivirga marina]